MSENIKDTSYVDYSDYVNYDPSTDTYSLVNHSIPINMSKSANFAPPKQKYVSYGFDILSEKESVKEYKPNLLESRDW